MMRPLGLLVVVLLGTIHCSTAYSAYQRSSYSSSQRSAPSYIATPCCDLNQWGYSHMDELEQFANILRQEYNFLYREGPRESFHSGRNSWPANMLQLTGLTSAQLDAKVRNIAQQLVVDARNDMLTSTFSQNNKFWLWKANLVLQGMCSAPTEFFQQQQQSMDFPVVQQADWSGYDQVKNYNSPVEVKVIEGIPYRVHTNYTEGTRNLANGGQETHKIRTSYASSSSTLPRGSQRIQTQRLPYSFDKYPYPSQNQDVETVYTPGSTYTMRRYNKTIIKNSDGTSKQYGSEVNRKWVDNKLVYDSEVPFGDWSATRDEIWKRKEREFLFWFLTEGHLTPERLAAWQRVQEERLSALAQRYDISLEDIYSFHEHELQLYRQLSSQYLTQTTDYASWQRIERGRLDWFIHQNSMTRDELKRWQLENSQKLQQLANKYNISCQEFKDWQMQELERLYGVFHTQNSTMLNNRTFNAESLRISEEQRVQDLLREHNKTIAELEASIAKDQAKLNDLSRSYSGSVKEMQDWLHNEIERLRVTLSEQNHKMENIENWQNAERARLLNILKEHHGSVSELENQIARDRHNINTQATNYQVSIEELEKWQKEELKRLQSEGQQQFDKELKDWQLREREFLKGYIQKNDLTIEEFQKSIVNDRARLQNLADLYKVQVSEIQEWMRNELKNFQNEGLLKEVRQELELWQKQERDRLQAIVQQNSLTMEELTHKIKNDQEHLFAVANRYQVGVEEVENWLKKELLRLQSAGLVKAEDLQEWQHQERANILQIVQENRLTIEEFEKKLLNDRNRLTNLANKYKVKTSEIENWFKQEGERLQNLGMLQIKEELQNWQKIERARILDLVNKNHLPIEQLEQKISKDQMHLYSLAQQHQVRVEEIEEWIKKEIARLQQEGVLEMSKLKEWQLEWRGNLTNMIEERDFTVEEFHKWLLQDRARLQDIAMQQNVQIEEIEQWVKKEEQRFVSMGLLKPSEKLTDWQEVERRYLERITQDQYKSTEQLEQRLRQDRDILERLARQYRLQVAEVEEFMKKDLQRLMLEGQVQINNLTAWQIAERTRVENLAKQNKQWNLEEFEAELRKDRESLQKTAFMSHTSVEQIDKWLKSEVQRLRDQGKLNIDNLTAWQKTERQRIINLLQQQSGVTAEEFEQRLQKDRNFVINLANQYRVDVNEVETFVKKVIADLNQKGRFEVEKLQQWQQVQRDYIKQLIAQYRNHMSTAEYEQKILNDRNIVLQLADQYHINVVQIENWMIEELKRLRQSSEGQIRNLAAWQAQEVQRLKELIRQNQNLTYVGFEVELLKERQRLHELARQHSLSVEEIENWLRQQLVNLKTTGQVEVENLTKWQEVEQKHLIEHLLQEEQAASNAELENWFQEDKARLERLAQNYSVGVEQVDFWMRNEIQRLKDSGLLQFEELTQWQKVQRDRFTNWLNQEHKIASYENFNDFLQHDKQNLQRIAQDYQVTVEEMESWALQEGARIHILEEIGGPQTAAQTIDWHSEYVDNAENLWKTQTLEHMKYYIDTHSIKTLKDVDNYIARQQERLQIFADQYHVTVEEIETWLRQVSRDYADQGMLQHTSVEEDWKLEEKAHIESLIVDQLRKQQQWSIEELERHLKNDREHMQKLSEEYRLTQEAITNWYAGELKRLLEQRRIISEHLVDWQRREKERLYNMAQQQPHLTIEHFKEDVFADTTMLQNLADIYKVNIEELHIWIDSEIDRLGNLGIISGQNAYNSARDWQKEERERLQTITTDLKITEQELLYFMEDDNEFQIALADYYGIGQEVLAPFQRLVIRDMQRGGRFDRTQLLWLDLWQRKERDHLYNLIKTQNFSYNNLLNWHRVGTQLQEKCHKYGISLQTLKNWHLKEFERLQKVAQHYSMTLKQLQEFRDYEVKYQQFIMHKKLSNTKQQQDWEVMEKKYIAILEENIGLYGEKLAAWRRRFYLLSQGLLALDSETYGGHEIGPDTFNRSASALEEISSGRGDLKPEVYEQDLNGEPVVASQAMEAATERQPTPSSGMYLPPEPKPKGRVAVEGGYTYTKKETQSYNPMGNRHPNNMHTRSLSGKEADQQQQQEEVDDFGQQQQEELGWNGRLRAKNQESQQQQQQEMVDYGQQQQEEVSWNGHLTAKNAHQQQQQQEVDDFGQQQQEELGWNGRLRAKNQESQQQQQQEVDDFGQQQQEELGWNGHLTAKQKQEQVHDFGQQQEVDLVDDQHTSGRLQNQQKQLAEDFGQQQVQVEDLPTFRTKEKNTSAKQIAANPTNSEQIVVEAEQEKPGFFTNLKNKIFG